MTNLLESTISAIKNSGHSVKDIIYIGSSDGEYTMSWAEYRKLADVEFDSSFGSSEVAIDLIIVFSDHKKMWRGEYDGSEWWEFHKPSSIDYSVKGKPITKLTGNLWPTLVDLHDPDSYKS
jgi:hypothetical protein